MLDHLTEIARRLKKELRDRRELRELLEKDDIMKDIGVTRADVEAALSKPIGLGPRREASRLARAAFYLDGGRFAPRR